MPASIERMPLAQPAKHNRAFQGKWHIGNCLNHLISVLQPTLDYGEMCLSDLLADFSFLAQFHFPGAGLLGFLAQESLLPFGLPFFKKQPG